MANNPKIKSPALRALFDRYIGEDPGHIASIEQEMLNAEIAQKLYDLRQEAGLTQEAFAERVGVDPLVISDLEEADYAGNSLETLKKIVATLGKKVEVLYRRSRSSEDSSWTKTPQGIGLAIH